MPRLTQIAGIKSGGAAAVFVDPTIAFNASTAPATLGTINEGQEATIIIDTTEIPNSTTISYAITGTVNSADISIGLTGSVIVSGNSATLTFVTAQDLTTESAETLTCTFTYNYVHPDNGSTDITLVYQITVADTSTTPLVPTYILGANKTSCNEGESFTVTLTTASVTNGESVDWTVSGITSADVGGASLTGTFVVGTLESVTFNVTADATTESAETFAMALDNGEDTISITINDTSLDPTYSLSSSVSTVNEGNSFSINLITTDVTNGTLVGYTITGVTTADINLGSLTGNFTVNNNAASLPITVTADQTLAEGNEVFNIALDNGADSVAVTIVDTSVDTTPAYLNFTLQTATSVNEGGTSTFRLTGRNIATGTTIVGTLTPVTGTIAGNDFVGNSTVKTITWAGAANNISQTQDFTVQLSADEITEGSESYKVVLAATDSAGTATGGLESPTITIGDTSVTPVTGQHDFTSSGSWTVPADVTKISILCIGGGGGGAGLNSSTRVSGAGGAGGSLAYANNVTVTPGEVLTATVGALGAGGAKNTAGTAGGFSRLNRSSTVLCLANGGGGASSSGSGGSPNTTFTGTVGYAGGAGGNGQTFGRAGGGGGAAGYSGVGGAGQQASSTSSGGAGSGGGGGGGGSSPQYPGQSGGGGVGKLGQGVSGAGGNYASDGGGGSGGEEGQNGVGGDYGGGGSGTQYNGNPSISGNGQSGAPGTVRVLYPGTSRQYPATRTVNEAQVAGTYDTLTISTTSIDESAAVSSINLVTFTLTTSDVPEGTTVGYTYISVTGTVNVNDFLSADTQFTINASGTATVAMRTDGDYVTEGTETFKIQLAATDSIGNETEGLQSPVVTISDDYPATVYNSISLNKSTYNEGEVVTITVDYTNNTDKAIQVPYTVTTNAGGTTDFDNTYGILNLLDGNTYEGSPYDGTKTTISADLLTEGTETMTVTLGSTDSNGNPTNSRSATATITDTSLSPRVPGQGLVGFIDKPTYGGSFGSGNNPEGTTTPYPSAGWGWSLGGSDDYIIIGDPLARGGQNSNANIGQAYIYNTANQNPINLLDNPYVGNSNLGERQSRFGSGVGIGEDSYGNLYAAVLCGYFQSSGNSLYDPKIIVYKSTNGFATVTLHKIVSFGDPLASGSWVDELQFSVHKDMCAVGSPGHGSSNSGTLRYFQLSTSTTTTTVCQQTGGFEMGNCVDINADTGYVFGGGPSYNLTQGQNTYVNVGLAQVFATSANQLVRTSQGRVYAGAQPNYANFKFGCGIADAGDYYAVSSGGDDYTVSGQGAFNDIGRIRFFQTSNASLRATVNNPIPYNSGTNGSGDYCAYMLRGNHDGYIACIWNDAYGVQTPILKVYTASNGAEKYSIASPGSTVIGLQTWTIQWGQALHLTDEHLYIRADDGVGFGVYRVYIY